MSPAWDKEKSLTGIEPMTFRHRSRALTNRNFQIYTEIFQFLRAHSPCLLLFMCVRVCVYVNVGYLQIFPAWLSHLARSQGAEELC